MAKKEDTKQSSKSFKKPVLIIAGIAAISLSAFGFIKFNQQQAVQNSLNEFKKMEKDLEDIVKNKSWDKIETHIGRYYKPEAMLNSYIGKKDNPTSSIILNSQSVPASAYAGKFRQNMSYLDGFDFEYKDAESNYIANNKVRVSYTLSQSGTMNGSIGGSDTRGAVLSSSGRCDIIYDASTKPPTIEEQVCELDTSLKK